MPENSDVVQIHSPDGAGYDAAGYDAETEGSMTMRASLGGQEQTRCCS